VAGVVKFALEELGWERRRAVEAGKGAGNAGLMPGDAGMMAG
jgi:hypothetical protein